jgi:16S rRNA (guanine527-N7)-methyltransferase
MELSSHQTERLADFYELVQEHNPIMHLVGPCSPEEFAVRHVLESLTLLPHLPPDSRFADVGPGAGFPSVPCLIVGGGLRAVLIESKERKSAFLQEVLEKCELTGRAEIVNRQFSELKRPDVSYVTCRALDKFAQKLPQLLKWSRGSTRLFFGGPALRDELIKLKVKFTERLMPMSEQRFLYVIADAADRSHGRTTA